ncbi:hypothetical protein FDECE_7989 [Fusarium decemcellulare]|nr:hypothetical protein FDECE_7989 [Fusarium decemcellulare]
MALLSGSFFPKADAALLSPDRKPLPPRPKTVGPIYDPSNFDSPIVAWTCDGEACFYPVKTDPHAASSIPARPASASDRYLRPHLARNERLRLSMLWYYTRDILTEPELLSGLQEKAYLAHESTGWEFAVIGLLDVNVYIRLATVGLQLAILPRGETLCAHTVTQPPGSVFLLPNMMEDWRFRESPYVEQGGLVAYAGVPLRIQHDSGESVGLGSLCVASSTSQEPLTKPQQQGLARLADWIVADIVKCARSRRQRERNRMAELIAEARRETEDLMSEEPVLRIMRAAYPDAAISLQSSRGERIETESGQPIFSSDVENGLWEDTAYIEEFICNSNQQDPPSDRVVRFIAAQCESELGPSLLVVATKDFRQIFDDVDAWFIQACAGILSQRWQRRLLSEVMRAKEKFLRGVSHQLRTPIHGILGAAELLAEDLKLATASLEADLAEVTGSAATKSSTYLDTISMAGRDLMSTVNGMITLNRWADIAMADREYAVHNIDVLETELAKGMSAAISGDSRCNASVFFSHALPAGRDSLRIDLNLLRDSLLPLIINAVQNTPDGVVTVAVSMKQDSTELVIDVEDTGCGIHPNDQHRIFELYEKVGEYSTGAGLGLTLATKFATLLHGSVELVSSELGRGSHFRAIFQDVDCVSLPLSTVPTLSKVTQTPSKFHHLASSSPYIRLSEHLTKSLVCHGLTSSETTQDCILVVDFVTDPEERHRYLSSMPPNQVAMCVVPPSAEKGSFEGTSGNIIYITGPVLTSAISLALEEAAKLMAGTNVTESKPLQPPKTLTSHPERCGSSSSDEGYGSMAVSPCPQEQLAQTPIASELHSTEPSVYQSDTVDNLETVTPTLTTTISPAKPRALLVDDNIVNLRILQMYCRKRGLPYCCATDGRQAVEMFTQNQALSSAGKEEAIQLVLMDLQMPVCDGIEATRQIRLLEKEAGQRASVLFVVTGQDSASDRGAASGAGADEYLVKPVGIKILDGELKRYFPAFVAN